jgi:hypothetical protein
MATKAKEDERKLILECIEVYHSLPALWNVKSKDYSNRMKKHEKYEQLLRKYGECSVTDKRWLGGIASGVVVFLFSIQFKILHRLGTPGNIIA